MYNLIIGYIGPTDSVNQVVVSGSRFLEYTDSETQMRYRRMTAEAVREIKSFPTLFMHEEYADGAFIATITNIESYGRDYRITFIRREENRILLPEEIKKLSLELGIEDFEFYRTHWAIKNTDLFRVLSENAVVLEPNNDSLEPTIPNKPAPANAQFNKDQVFIVHGHDVHAKNDVKEYIISKGLEPIILHLQASGGKTIIEKIDHYSNVGFGVVIYSECDIGAKRDSLDFKWRARQNVVFEHGYLIAKLSRPRVAALVKGTVETPNDISGVIYITMDAAGEWKSGLDAELRNAGFDIRTS